MRARDLHARSNEADTVAARLLLEQAVATDPDYAPAHAWLAYTIQRGFTHWWGEPKGPEALQLALFHARRAVALEGDSPLCLACLAFILLLSGQHEASLRAARAAVVANPASWVAHFDYGIILTEVGNDAGEGLREIQAALDLDPHHSPWARYALGNALLLAGNPEQALSVLDWCTARLPDYLPGRENMVVAAFETERPELARRSVAEVPRLGPHWTLATIASKWAYFKPVDFRRFHRAFQYSGMPED